MKKLRLNKKRLQQEMARLNLNQNKLAVGMGVDRSMITRVLNNPSGVGLRFTERLADYFGIDPKDLLI